MPEEPGTGAQLYEPGHNQHGGAVQGYYDVVVGFGASKAKQAIPAVEPGREQDVLKVPVGDAGIDGKERPEPMLEVQVKEPLLKALGFGVAGEPAGLLFHFDLAGHGGYQFVLECAAEDLSHGLEPEIYGAVFITLGAHLGDEIFPVDRTELHGADLTEEGPEKEPDMHFGVAVGAGAEVCFAEREVLVEELGEERVFGFAPGRDAEDFEPLGRVVICDYFLSRAFVFRIKAGPAALARYSVGMDDVKPAVAFEQEGH